MSVTSLMPGQLYWARSSRHFNGNLAVVEVSSVFGEPGLLDGRDSRLRAALYAEPIQVHRARDLTDETLRHAAE
jgi:hypothetical protein